MTKRNNIDGQKTLTAKQIHALTLLLNGKGKVEVAG